MGGLLKKKYNLQVSMSLYTIFFFIKGTYKMFSTTVELQTSTIIAFRFELS